MPKSLNPRCISCASITTAEARGRSCWDSSVCHNRRSHYRRRLAQQAEATPQGNSVPVLDVPLPNSVYAVLYCYLTEDHRLHAVTAELYRGDAIVAKAAPTHVGALTERVINLYLQNVLDAFSTHLNRTHLTSFPLTLGFEGSRYSAINSRACSAKLFSARKLRKPSSYKAFGFRIRCQMGSIEDSTLMKRCKDWRSQF